MRIAYLILAHDQPELFGRLARAVHAENVAIYAHIDAKFDPAVFASACGDVPVDFVPDPVKVNWGGFSQVAAMLKLLEHALRAGTHDYYIFLSGRDFPLHSHGHLLEVLRRHPGRSYMNFYALADGTDQVTKIRNYCYHDLYARLPTRFLRRVAAKVVKVVSARLPDRRFVDGMQAYRGSTSWCISQDIARHIVDFTHDPRNGRFLEFFQSVSCSDEIYFQTIVLNSPHAATLNLYDVDGRRRPGEMKNENKASLHYIDWNPQREDPAILVDRDFEPLYSSGKLFARKFDAQRSASLLDKIEAVRAGQVRAAHGMPVS
ncbi:hypothetical protein OU994_08505 [Pseudoduganella sp. SL102]|uniref:beta-1,6-N-acetylglucosaminyltransferase n=1 Tax=Pseudoduganella sp. SL102 TaxID=2995154 RepID=UPI00248B3E5E|nr:beta-1,6-N-acetylglucosaminyltransferase [Pseudoduganella sp. SL102]WBS04304.1 hypothetical protein OU994_08505 [Pseudoduganella sp. SL102]